MRLEVWIWGDNAKFETIVDGEGRRSSRSSPSDWLIGTW